MRRRLPILVLALLALPPAIAAADGTYADALTNLAPTAKVAADPMIVERGKPATD